VPRESVVDIPAGASETLLYLFVSSHLLAPLPLDGPQYTVLTIFEPSRTSRVFGKTP
jgi:hypothetical protein